MARRTISIDELDHFSVDEDTNQLFWRNLAVVTAVSLPRWVQVAALAGGLGSAVSALVAVAALVIRLLK